MHYASLCQPQHVYLSSDYLHPTSDCSSVVLCFSFIVYVLQISFTYSLQFMYYLFINKSRFTVTLIYICQSSPCLSICISIYIRSILHVYVYLYVYTIHLSIFCIYIPGLPLLYPPVRPLPRPPSAPPYTHPLLPIGPVVIANPLFRHQ